MSELRRSGQMKQRGEGKWLLRIYLGRDASGKRSYFNETYKGTKKQAERRLNKLLNDHSEGTLTKKPRETLSQYLESWLTDTAAKRVRQRTLNDYRHVVEKHLSPGLGNASLAKLTTADVKGLITDLSAKGLSPRSVRKAHEVLRNALEAAVADGLIRVNPAKGRAVAQVLPKKDHKEYVTIPAEKVGKFVEAAKEDRLGAYWLVLLYGGLRPEEALALRWSDLRNGTLHINRVLVDKTGQELHYEAPKTAKSARAVPLPEEPLKALEAWRTEQKRERLAAGPAWSEDPKHADLIFTAPDGSWTRQDHTRAPFRRVLKAAELPAMRIYDLRHTSATLLLEQGLSLKVVAERLGHSTIALTADTYSHVTPTMQQKAVAALDSLIG